MGEPSKRIAVPAGRVGRILPAAALAVLILVAPALSPAVGPTETIKDRIDEAVAILQRPDLKGKAQWERRRALLEEAIKPVFNFQEMSRRALGVHWRRLTPEQRDRFVTEFTALLKDTYLGKVETYEPGGEKVRYTGEVLKPPYAQVNTVVITERSTEHPIAYRMIRDGEDWQIYDVVIEGISLVNNYRTQFNAILQRSSFEEMLQDLRAKVKPIE
jgi:phospholipid transport system substrate-binding protein